MHVRIGDHALCVCVYVCPHVCICVLMCMPNVYLYVCMYAYVHGLCVCPMYVCVCIPHVCMYVYMYVHALCKFVCPHVHSPHICLVCVCVYFQVLCTASLTPPMTSDCAWCSVITVHTASLVARRLIKTRLTQQTSPNCARSVRASWTRE